MFNRLLVSDLMNHFALISFAIFFAIFLITAIWALCISRERIRRLENLPLDSDQNEHERHA
jgi:hypothetical protein